MTRNFVILHCVAENVGYFPLNLRINLYYPYIWIRQITTDLDVNSFVNRKVRYSI